MPATEHIMLAVYERLAAAFYLTLILGGIVVSLPSKAMSLYKAWESTPVFLRLLWTVILTRAAHWLEENFGKLAYEYPVTVFTLFWCCFLVIGAVYQGFFHCVYAFLDTRPSDEYVEVCDVGLSEILETVDNSQDRK
jgi:hypothetical protein